MNFRTERFRLRSSKARFAHFKDGSTILISFLSTPLIDHYNYTHLNLSQKNDDMTCREAPGKKLVCVRVEFILDLTKISRHYSLIGSKQIKSIM